MDVGDAIYKSVVSLRTLPLNGQAHIYQINYEWALQILLRPWILFFYCGTGSGTFFYFVRKAAKKVFLVAWSLRGGGGAGWLVKAGPLRKNSFFKTYFLDKKISHEHQAREG